MNITIITITILTTLRNHTIEGYFELLIQWYYITDIDGNLMFAAESLSLWYFDL